MKKLVIGFALILSVAGASAFGSVDKVYFAEDLPEEHPVDKSIEIKGTAEGYNLDKVKVLETSEFTKVVGTEECDDSESSECTVEVKENFDEGVKEFKVEGYAGDVSDDSKSQPVKFVKDEENQLPASDFKIYPQPSEPGETVLLDASCLSGQPCAKDPDGDIETYLWDLDGDEEYGDATGNYVTVSFEEDTEVGLRVKDNNGEYNTKRKTVQISDFEDNQAPASDFKIYPQPVEQEKTVSFDASCSTGMPCAKDPDGSIDAYLWDLDGDRNYGDATGKFASHSYQEDTEVGLRVRDNDGSYTTKRKTVQVSAEPEETTLEVNIVDVSGSPLDGIVVAESSEEPTISRETTDGSTTLSLNPGVEYMVSAEVEGYPSASETVTLQEGEFRTITIELEGEADLVTPHLEVRPSQGSVGDIFTFDASGSESQSSQIERYRFDIDNDGIWDRDWSSESEYDERIDQEFSGEAKVQVEDADGNKDTATESYTVTDRETGTLVVDLEDLQRNALEDVEVEVRRSESSTEFENQELVEGKETDENGEARFELSPDEYDVRVSKQGYTSDIDENVVVESGETSYSLFNLEETGTTGDEGLLRIDVEDTEGNSLEDAEVEVRASESGNLVETRTTGENGRAEFVLDPGTYDVEASKQNYIAEVERDVEIDAEEVVHGVFDLQREDTETGDLRVDVEDIEGEALEDATVEVVSDASFGGERIVDSKETDQDGQTVFELAEGSYDVEASKDSYVSEVEENVEIVAGEETHGVFSLEEADQQCNLDVDNLDVSDTSIEAGGEVEASIDVENEMDEEQDVTVSFEAGEHDEEIEREIGAGDEETFETEFEPDESVELEVEVETEGEPCGSQTISTQSQEITVGEVPEDKARFTTEVLDEDEEPIRRAEVEIREETDDGFGDSRLVERKRTDSDGIAEFELDPGEYEVKASSTGYRSEIEDVELDEGDDIYGVFELNKIEEELRIGKVNHPEEVCRGEDLSVRVLVSNTYRSSQDVKLRGQGLGSITTKSFTVPTDESRVKTLVFPNVDTETPGNEESFTVTMENGEVETVQRNIDVVECAGQIDPGRATGITLDVSPKETESGSPIKVSGFVDGVRRGKEVTITVNGRTEATTDTAPDGYYETFITPTGAGGRTVTASTGSHRKSRDIELLPTISMGFVQTPRQAFQGEEFEVCGKDIRSQVTPQVYLKEDGEIIDSKRDSGDVCFEVTNSEVGEHRYTVEALAGSQRTSTSKDLSVYKAGTETRSFPDQIASVESGSGTVKATLYNTYQESKTYELQMDGVPEDWFSQTEKEVVVQPGEEKEVFFYVTPKDQGSFEAEMEIENEGETLHEQKVQISSIRQPRNDRTFLERIFSIFA